MTAVYKAQHLLTVASSNPSSNVSIAVTPADIGNHSSDNTQFTRTYWVGSAVTLTALPTAGGNNFIEWRRGGVHYSTSMTINFAMTADYTFTAVYATPYELTVASLNPSSGVDIAISPADNYSHADGSTMFVRTYNSGTSVALTAPPTSNGNVFAKWQLDGADYSISAATSIAVAAAHTITAVYGSSYSLTVASLNPASGVSIIVSPADISSASNGDTQFIRTYAAGSTVTLTVPSIPGSVFQKWQRGGSDYSTSPTTSVVMDAAYTMTAVLAYVPTYPLTVASVNPASGVSVTLSPADNAGHTDGSTRFDRDYNSGTVVSLAAPASTSGNNFQKWQRNGVNYSTNPAITVSMVAAATMTAVYRSPAPTVTSITPSTGGNSASVSITNLAGTGFLSTPTVVLRKSGQSDITATNVVLVSSGQLTCTLSLSSAVPGAWDVVVTNPDSQSGVLTAGFTITMNDNTPPLGTPTAPAPGFGTGGDLAFTWTLGTATDPESGIIGYHLQVGTSSATNDVSLFDGDVGDVLTKDFPYAVSGQTYYARVCAINGGGLRGSYSTWSAGVSNATVNPASDTIVQTADGVTVTIPAGALTASARLIVMVPDTYTAPPSNSGFTTTNLVREFLLSDGTSSFQKTITIVIPYTAADIAGIPESNLHMFYFDAATGTWVLIPGSAAIGGQVTAHVNHFTKFGVFGFSGNFADASNYPNPFSPLKGETTKIRYNLPADTAVSIKIYSAFGHKVWTQSFAAGAAGGRQGSNEVIWDGKTGSGRVVAMGGYLCYIDAGGTHTTVKVGVK